MDKRTLDTLHQLAALTGRINARKAQRRAQFERKKK